MPIKVEANSKKKVVGRVTYPRGTYLGNPSTAADGSFSGPMGNNPATIVPQIAPLASYHSAQSGQGFWTGVKNWWNNLPGSKAKPTMYNALGQPITGPTSTETWNGVTTTKTNNVAYDRLGNEYKLDTSTNTFVREPTAAFRPLSKDVLGEAPKYYANNLVGLDMGARPSALEFKTGMQLFPGQTNEDVMKGMQELGYEFVPGPRGGTFVLSNGGNGGNGVKGGGGYYGGANLAPGEKFHQPGSGVYVIGGTPTKEGVGQYAMIRDLGKTPWKTIVKQDRDGNWVRMNVPDYAFFKKRSASRRARATAASSTSGQKEDATQGNQLVNLRVNYG